MIKISCPILDRLIRMGLQFLCLYLFYENSKASVDHDLSDGRENDLFLQLRGQVFVFKASFSTFLLAVLSYTASDSDSPPLFRLLDSHPALHLLRLFLLGGQWAHENFRFSNQCSDFQKTSISKGQMLPLPSCDYFIKLNSPPLDMGVHRWIFSKVMFLLNS